jgi:hypothetical protein
MPAIGHGDFGHSWRIPTSGVMNPPWRAALPAMRTAIEPKETTMTLRLCAFLFTLCAAAAAVAAPSRVTALAGETGLREREVRMLAGAPSAYAEYRTSFRRLSEQAARRGLDLRTLAAIDRHARELDRAVALSMRADARPSRPVLVAGR